jgi:thiol:disulfide interchange protein
MKKTYYVIISVAILLIGGGYFFLGNRGEEKSAIENVAINRSDESASPGDQQATDQKTSNQRSDYPTNYRDYSVSELEKAKNDRKVVMLYFTANWCPTCRAQEPVNVEAFNELEDDEDIVIFKIHILDSDTTDETEKLAEEYGVRLQHTFIVLDPNGEVVFTHTGPLVKDDIVSELIAAK